MGDLRTDFFSPYSIDKIFLWYDATRTDTITKDGSNRVSTWADLGPNGIDLTNSAADGTKPVYTASAINSKPALLFDGGDYLETVNTIYDHESSGPFQGDYNKNRRQTYVWVALATESTSSYCVWRIGSSTNDCAFYSRHSSHSNYPIYWQDSSYSRKDIYQPASGNPQDDTTNPHMWRCNKGALTTKCLEGGTWYNDGCNNRLYIDENRCLRNASSNPYYVYMGAAELFNLGSQSYKGYISEVIVYDKYLCAREGYYLQKYLSAKWGV